MEQIVLHVVHHLAGLLPNANIIDASIPFA